MRSESTQGCTLSWVAKELPFTWPQSGPHTRLSAPAGKVKGRMA